MLRRSSAAPQLGSRERFRAHLRRLREGVSPAVRDQLRAAVGYFDKVGADLYARRAQHDFAETLDALGEHDAAGALRIQVREFYESIGATRWLHDLDSTQEK